MNLMHDLQSVLPVLPRMFVVVLIILSIPSCDDGERVVLTTAYPEVHTARKTLALDGYRIVGNFPVGWDRWTIEEDIKLRKHPKFREITVRQPSEIAGISFAGGYFAPDKDQSCALLVLVKKKCKHSSCSDLTKDMTVRRRGQLYARKHIKNNRKGLFYRWQFWVNYVANSGGELIECSGYDSCDYDGKMSDLLFHLCTNIKIKSSAGRSSGTKTQTRAVQK